MTGFTHEITFRPASEKPTKDEAKHMSPVLLFNTCDGYHTAFAHFSDEGEFEGFFEWMDPQPFTTDMFSAWAVLPNELDVRFDFMMD